jgi:hypothetical protein
LPRSLKTVFTFGGFLILLIALQDLKSDFPLKEFIDHVIPHLVIVATSVIVGGMLLWIIEEAIEAHIAPAITAGLRTVASQIAHEVKRFPDRRWRGLKEVLEESKAKNITTPGVKELADAGKIEEALKKSRERDEHLYEEELTILLESKKLEDWARGVDLLGKIPHLHPRFFLGFAYLYWTAGEPKRGIEIAERGLAEALKLGDGTYIRKLHNSLAYYYAETKNPLYEAKAREYAALARESDPEAPGPIDTEAFVKVSFARTKQEVLEGIALAQSAVSLGVPFEFYTKTVNLANERMRELGDATKPAG